MKRQRLRVPYLVREKVLRAVPAPDSDDLLPVNECTGRRAGAVTVARSRLQRQMDRQSDRCVTIDRREEGCGPGPGRETANAVRGVPKELELFPLKESRGEAGTSRDR
jgi:hypothetical protein